VDLLRSEHGCWWLLQGDLVAMHQPGVTVEEPISGLIWASEMVAARIKVGAVAVCHQGTDSYADDSAAIRHDRNHGQAG